MNDLVSRPLSFAELQSLGELFARSDYFPDARTAAKAVVKIQTGAELGFPPMASMSGVHVIEGKPAIGAHLMAAMIKRSGRYNYTVTHLDRERCELEFFERQSSSEHPRFESVGSVAFTLKEAIETKLALTKDGSLKANWSRAADDMLFARCISKGYRRYCPDLSCGLLVYTTDELDLFRETNQEVKPDFILPSAAALPEVEPVQVLQLNDCTPLTAVPATEPTPVPRITDAQQGELAKLIQATKTDTSKLLAHYRIKALQQLPMNEFDGLVQILTERLAASQSAKQPTDDAAKIAVLRSQIDQLVHDLNISSTDWSTRIMQLYGTVDPGVLALAELEDLYAKLTAVKSKKIPHTPAA